MRKSFLLLALTAFCAVGMTAKSPYPSTIDGILKMLDETIERRKECVAERFSKADSLKSLMAEGADSARMLEEIGGIYRSLSIDSAIAYYAKGIECARRRGDSVSEQRFRLLRSAIMPASGIIRESVEEFDSVKNIFTENREVYFESGSRLFSYAMSFYSQPEMKDSYKSRYMHYSDSLLSVVPAGSVKHKLYSAELMYIRGDNVVAMALVDDVIAETDISKNIFARATSLRAMLADRMSNPDECIYYFALSAISDMIRGTREEISLRRLGIELYGRGDIERAYSVLTISMNNAVNSGSRLRVWETSQVQPIIAQTYRAQDKRKMMWLGILIVCLTVALIMIVCFLVYLHREKNKLEILRMRLTKSNYVKETYISQFLNLCSLYMDKLEEFNKIAGRKITAGQIDELYAMIKEGKMLEAQHKLFYEVFDDAFCHIYPTFVADVNQLLQDDKAVELSGGSKLNMELRILAFLRLGVDDSSQISRFLGLSLNTIYTYRNKMKSRAKDRDNFEKNILKIGRIS